jgi:ArsR family transcriptional regulator, lead/cadmium/zinc/bismuth-responsive transcriptional repressor
MDCVGEWMTTSTNRSRRVLAAAAGQLEDLVGFFKALSDPTRLRIVLALADEGEMCVHQLCAHIGLSQPAVSHQLAVLRGRRLVRGRRDGRETHYALDDEHVLGVLSAGLSHAGHGRG